MKFFLVFPEKKVNFLFIFFVKGENLKLFPSYFSLILLGSAYLVGIILEMAENAILMGG